MARIDRSIRAMFCNTLSARAPSGERLQKMARIGRSIRAIFCNTTLILNKTRIEESIKEEPYSPTDAATTIIMDGDAGGLQDAAIMDGGDAGAEREDDGDGNGDAAPATNGDAAPATNVLDAAPATSNRNVNRQRTNRNLTNNERLAVLHILLQHQASPGRLQRKATRKAADAHKVTPQTCLAIWKRYKETVSEDCPGGDVSNNRKNCGRKQRATRLEESF
eukprot:jgi/Psemu1/17359/gm1.17359_g